jgi:hypothetical protein
MAIDEREQRSDTNKEFIYGGFKKAPVAMFMTLMALAIIGLFIWCVNMSKTISDNATQSVRDAREDRDKQVDQIVRILRPDLQEIKENVQQANDNVDSVKINAINKNKRK